MEEENDTFLRMRDILKIIPGIGRATLYQRIKEQRFIKPYKLSSRLVLYSKNELMLWIQEHRTDKATDKK